MKSAFFTFSFGKNYKEDIVMPYWLGVDVGGTFTDLTLFHAGSGNLFHYKLSSTPDDPSLAIIEGIRRIMETFSVKAKDISYLAHGTTVATNALIQKKGGKTALITTKGYKDLLEIGRQTRPSLYDFSCIKQEPLVHGQYLREVDERILYDGSVHRKLNEDETVRIVKELKESNVDSIAVCTIFSYVNPIHEKKIESIIRENFPSAYVSVSHRVSPEFREVPRMSTTVVNAFLEPVMGRYIENFQNVVTEIGIHAAPYITQSNGSIISINEAKSSPVRTALSGPSSGVVAAQYIAGLRGDGQIVTFDMGGTSADICLLVNGVPSSASERELEGYTLRIPMINIKTVGAGGGSIAHVDEGGALKVGPDSAGAIPGPAAYMRGGVLPTVTDANIILGRLDPFKLLNGRMDIDRSLAERSVRKYICEKTGLELAEAAKGIIDVVNANMMRVIRVVSVEQGYDIREFALVAFGGAGPLHACDLAEELGMQKIIIPTSPGTFCSLGLLIADVRYDYVRTSIQYAEQESLKKINEIFSNLEQEGTAFLESENIPPEDRRFVRQIDARYHMQNYELSISLPEGKLNSEGLETLCRTFHMEHERNYGYCDQSQKVELVNFRMSAIGCRKKPELASNVGKDSKVLVARSERDVFFNGYGTIRCPIYHKDELPTGISFSGPAIVEQMDTTVVITPSWKCIVDRWGNICMDRQKEEVAK